MTTDTINTTRVSLSTPGDDRLRAGNATLSVRRCSRHRVAVAVRGDIDAVNARDLARYVAHHARGMRQVVLDLRSVDFFGTSGFTALYYVGVHCARTDVDWAIVGSRQVRRLLSICDPDSALPLAEDLSSALRRLDRIAPSHHAASGSTPRRESGSGVAGHDRAS